MKDNIKDIASIIACIWIAYFVAIAASVGEMPFLWSTPVVLLCACVSFAVHWAIAIPSLLTSSEIYFDFTGMIATLLVVATAMIALFSSAHQISIRSIVVAAFV